jgi:hypothetical protein
MSESAFPEVRFEEDEMAQIRVLKLLDAEELKKWDEASHPRANDGKFGSGGGGAKESEEPVHDYAGAKARIAASMTPNEKKQLEQSGLAAHLKESKAQAKPVKESKGKWEAKERKGGVPDHTISGGDKSAHVRHTRAGEHIVTLHGGDNEGKQSKFATLDEAKTHAENHVYGENKVSRMAPEPAKQSKTSLEGKVPGSPLSHGYQNDQYRMEAQQQKNKAQAKPANEEDRRAKYNAARQSKGHEESQGEVNDTFWDDPDVQHMKGEMRKPAGTNAEQEIERKKEKPAIPGMFSEGKRTIAGTNAEQAKQSKEPSYAGQDEDHPEFPGHIGDFEDYNDYLNEQKKWNREHKQRQPKNIGGIGGNPVIARKADLPYVDWELPG